MLVVAAIAAYAAASVYPWPEAVVISDAVNKPLFEGFDTRNVRSIRIETYNEDRNEIERLLVRRKGEEWVLPSHSSFVADSGRQLGAICLLYTSPSPRDKRQSRMPSSA